MWGDKFGGQGGWGAGWEKFAPEFLKEGIFAKTPVSSEVEKKIALWKEFNPTKTVADIPKEVLKEWQTAAIANIGTTSAAGTAAAGTAAAGKMGTLAQAALWGFPLLSMTPWGQELGKPKYNPNTMTMEEYEAQVAAWKQKNLAGLGSDAWQLPGTLPSTLQYSAQGGRIGAQEGGIQGLMPQQGFMPQPGLDPRMGYALGGPQEQISETENFNWGGPDVVETANIREKALFNNPIFDRDVQALEKEQTGKFDEIVRQDLMERVMKYIRDAGGSYKVPERSYWEALSKAIEAGDEDVIEYLSQSLYGYPKRVAKQEMPMGAAQGGRIGAQEGGLMNLGGMEKDYRQEGGFVPIGGQEKADDVPARLSKNEFVFTADAVRAAGGGDIDAGAEVMENVMENLEQGGQVSEESQGLEGARNMFATAQRLGGVI